MLTIYLTLIIRVSHLYNLLTETFLKLFYFKETITLTDIENMCSKIQYLLVNRRPVISQTNTNALHYILFRCQGYFPLLLIGRYNMNGYVPQIKYLPKVFCSYL